MYKNKYFFLLLLFVAARFSVQAQTQFQYLIGIWKVQNKEIYEQWKVGNDGQTLVGKSYRITKGDTLVSEEIKLGFKDGSYYYTPDVAGKQTPVDFKIIQYNDSSFVAENQLHDFPKVIRYMVVRKNNQSFIEATIQGGGKTIPYSFIKIR